MTGAIVTGFNTSDVRYPTSRHLDGSDAMNAAPDYSAAYLTIETDAKGLEGHGFTFTIGRGNDVQVAAIASLEPMLVGRRVDELIGDLGATYKRLTWDSQLRWLGPEKGIMHMAIGAVVNALWDLRSREEGRPLWQVLGAMSPDEIISLVDFRYLDDVLSPAAAHDRLADLAPTRDVRAAELIDRGYPAYSTSPGWLGYTDDKLARLSAEAVDQGFDLIKLKVGRSLQDDLRRLRVVRDVVGPNVRVAVDANQAWGIREAIERVRAMSEFDLWWIEEPTNPDDVLGHAEIARAVAPTRVATGEHCSGRVMFKQFFQTGGCSIAQIDATRVAGYNENIAILLLAAEFGIPVCPHAGGVGLCEIVQHLSYFDYIAVSGRMDDRAIEYIDHLHDEFVTPVRVERGRYKLPMHPGTGAQLRQRSLAEHTFQRGRTPPEPSTSR